MSGAKVTLWTCPSCKLGFASLSAGFKVLFRDMSDPARDRIACRECGWRGDRYAPLEVKVSDSKHAED